jgi:hypothetical protein
MTKKILVVIFSIILGVLVYRVTRKNSACQTQLRNIIQEIQRTKKDTPEKTNLDKDLSTSHRTEASKECEASESKVLTNKYAVISTL